MNRCRSFGNGLTGVTRESKGVGWGRHGDESRICD